MARVHLQDCGKGKRGAQAPEVDVKLITSRSRRVGADPGCGG
jgi:hypothetical protein